ncbi:serine/threonine-protein kinase [Runella aurantiaca]|uniref:Serine/threonine protein kinase n=1 Tax=Runella aurantiaca TaxID=2282308 RepID=A0A369I2A5_9BACT|nr:serine/threonine-protein kinase [Runella aurantiaca]RDB02385.1 serine/threonine protein kinase [Runella aurantiaca]
MNPTFTTFQDFKKRYPIQFREKGTWLGSGTYGKVFKVEDQVETEWVAIKISEYRQNDTKSLKAEVELAQKVPRHANIARYDACYRLETDTGVSDFAVMKYYPDGNLADLLKRNKLSDKELRDIIQGILEGLKHLHQQRIVHRDFKPANILISRGQNGRFVTKIADFGLSKLVSQDEVDSSDFDLSDGRGTPSYKAPEQIEGGRVSFNLDLWAFGVILYEMLTGEKPFSVGTQSSEPTLRREIERKITSVQLPDRLRTIPEPYQGMIRRCLVKDIRQRVRKADELLELLGKPLINPPLPSKTIEKPSVLPADATDVYVKPKRVVQEAQTDVYASKVVVQKPEIQFKSKNRWFWGLIGGVAVVLLGIGFFPKGENQLDVREPHIKNEIERTKNADKQIDKSESLPKIKPEKSKKELVNESNSQLDEQKELEQKKRRLEENENQTQAAIALKKQQAQQEYDDLIEKGMVAINSSNNKGNAIAQFNQASRLAEADEVVTAKAANAYAIYLAKGDRIFANGEYEGAKAWYRVAQSLRNTEEVRRKIKECDDNL